MRDLVNPMLCFLRDYRGGREKAEALIALARENGFSYLRCAWPGFSGTSRSARRGNRRRHQSDTRREGKRLRAAGEILAFQVVQWLSGRGIPDGRTPRRGVGGRRRGNRCCRPTPDPVLSRRKLHRLKGELLLLAGAPESDAEASMRRAIAIAQRQEAKGWELRAATSLARLLRKQGRIAEAREVLAPVYNWFTEGFDTADLKDAKALLDELSA